MNTAGPRPELLPLGQDGILVRFSSLLDDRANRAAMAFSARVRSLGVPAVTETATALSSALVRFDPVAAPRRQVAKALADLIAERDWYSAPLPEGRRRWTIPAAFGGDPGPQFDEAAAMANRSGSEAIADLTGQALRVLALGFAPGQPYLGTLPDHWNIPRQTALTREVPAGAIVVAVSQIVLFAAPAPTGWRQVGLCGFRCYRPGTEEPFPLRAGDEVTFEAVGRAELDRILTLDADGLGGAKCETIA